MKCTRDLLLVALFSVASCFKIVNVKVDQDGDRYAPSRIFAHSNSTIRFLLPSRFHTIVQSTFDKPCTPLHGGFNSVCGGESLHAKGWDLHVKNKSQPIWFFYHNALRPNHCDRNTVGAINPRSTCEYAEFQRAANLPKPKSMTRAAQFACPTATKSSLPISSPTLATQLSQQMTSTAPSPTRFPAQRDVGAIVGGTVVGVLLGIIVLVILANAAFFLYRWRKRNGDLEANKNHPAPPPATRAVENALPAPVLVEMTQVSVTGDEMRSYQPLPSGDISPNNTPDASAAASLLFSMNDMKAQDPPMRKMSIRFSPPSPHEMVSRPLVDGPTTPSLYLIPSDPFASIGQALPVDSSQDHQQQEPQHQIVARTPSIPRSARRSRSDSVFQPTQPTIPEQEMEFIAQEVVTFILTDATSVEQQQQRTSRHLYSSPPPAGQSSPTLEHSRHSPTLSHIQRSPTLGFSPPPLTFRRPLSRGSSMEGG